MTLEQERHRIGNRDTNPAGGELEQIKSMCVLIMLGKIQHWLEHISHGTHITIVLVLQHY